MGGCWWRAERKAQDTCLSVHCDKLHIHNKCIDFTVDVSTELAVHLLEKKKEFAQDFEPEKKKRKSVQDLCSQTFWKLNSFV